MVICQYSLKIWANFSVNALGRSGETFNKRVGALQLLTTLHRVLTLTDFLTDRKFECQASYCQILRAIQPIIKTISDTPVLS